MKFINLYFCKDPECLCYRQSIGLHFRIICGSIGSCGSVILANSTLIKVYVQLLGLAFKRKAHTFPFSHSPFFADLNEAEMLGSEGNHHELQMENKRCMLRMSEKQDRRY